MMSTGCTHDIRSKQPTRRRTLLVSVLTTGILCIAFQLVVSQAAFAATQASQSSTTQHRSLATPGQIQGIQGDGTTAYPHISWQRLGYPTCGWGNLKGQQLRDTIQSYHQQGIRVLLTVCQPPNTSKNLYDTAPLKDAAQGRADAVQCGNEEMKQASDVPFLYLTPSQFARWYDLCQQAMHAVQPNVTVLVGSLDPHVGGIDIIPLWNQVHYLDQMQAAMNSSIHPHGTWDWHTQTLGLIDTWHNGYPTSASNSLYGLFVFWAQRFNVNLAGGGLGNHLWTVEGTGCFIGCGLDPNNAAQEATSHIVTLITDVLTAKQYNVPFFFFSGKDFISMGIKWPIGVLDLNGHDKPLRQDLNMGARKLTMRCTSSYGGTYYQTVQGQEDLLASMYNSCTLPGNYLQILES